MNKTVKIILAIFALALLTTGSFSGGFLVRHFLPLGSSGPSISFLPGSPTDVPTLPQGHPPISTTTPADKEALFAPFWQTWDIVHQYYVSQPVDDVVLMQGAIRGMLETLEVGRNYYLTAEENRTSQEILNGRDYTGIGAWVDVEKEYLTIISPIKGSPAEQAGLRPGDMILAIDGEDMTGVDPEQARQKVLGPENTPVTLTIGREGQDSFDVTLVRARIITPLVEYEMLEGNIAYVRLNTFGDTADEELRAALTELLAQNPKGLVLDLRYNGGGYLDQATAVTSEFLEGRQTVAFQVYGDGTREEEISSGDGVATSIPMVVLVNEGTASAAEIVSGALQDYGRAILVGTITFGKGSVQAPIPLDNDQGLVGITIATWLTPKENTIQDTGLTPDVIVELTEEDAAAGRDPQLDKAIELLSQ